MAIDALQQCPLFAGMNEEDLRRIRGIALSRKAAKGDLLFAEGEEAKGLYVVLSGRVKLYKMSPDGKEQILHVVSAPEAFAEAALFEEGTYPAYAEALTASLLIFFPKIHFLRLIEQHPRLGVNMIVSLSRLLKRFASLIEELSLKEVSSRLAKHLLDLSVRATRDGKRPDEVELDLTKTQLAARLGTVSETLSRTLTKMKAKGAIEVRGSRIRIVSRPALEELAAGMKL
jgi:CRP/FNR family transcriptional regulator, dissimilatory nitrate respiration regulator